MKRLRTKRTHSIGFVIGFLTLAMWWIMSASDTGLRAVKASESLAREAGGLAGHNSERAADKSARRQDKQSAREADSPTLSIDNIKMMRAEHTSISRAGNDMAVISITSAGWQPGETVEVSIYKPGAVLPDATFSLVADEKGRLINSKLMLLSSAKGPRQMTAVGRGSEKFVSKKFRIMDVNGGPFVNTFEQTCTTLQTSFVLGDTVCAQVTGIDPSAITARFDWIDPDNITQEMGPVIVADGQTDTFTIPAMGPNAKTGLWRVQISDVKSGSNIASQGFNVTAPGPQPEAIATYQEDCETPDSLFFTGSTVCAKVTGIDAGDENLYRIDWIRPDSSVAEMGPIVTMNNQTDTFAIPGAGPAGTWTVQLTNISKGFAQAQATFTVEILPCSIVCPEDISVANDPGDCGAVVNYSPPFTQGDCGVITCTPASGSRFPVGTTTVNCTQSSVKQPTMKIQGRQGEIVCSFTVTVTDNEAPHITCPANIAAKALTTTCGPLATSTAVTYPAPTVTDNCSKVSPICSPPSGSIFPVGTTTVTCSATDANKNTSFCSFTVTVFNGCLQDDSNPNIVVLFNLTSGAYRFCCNGTTYTGTGTVTKVGCVYTIQQNASDRKVTIKIDLAVGAGSASVQAPPGSTRCTITDRNIANNTCNCP